MFFSTYKRPAEVVAFVNIISRQLVFAIILTLGATSVMYSWSLLPCLGDCLKGKIEQSHLPGDILSKTFWTEADITIGSCENCDACEDYYHSSSNSLLNLASSLHPAESGIFISSNYIQLLGYLPDPYRSPPA